MLTPFVNEEMASYWKFVFSTLYRQICETENAEENTDTHFLKFCFKIARFFQRTSILLCKFGFRRQQNGRCYCFCYMLVFLCDAQGYLVLSIMFVFNVASLICMPMLRYMPVIKIK